MTYNVASKWAVIEGLPELVAKLRTFSDRIYRKHARRAMTKAGRIFAARAKAAAPRETGLLKLSLGSKVATYAKSNSIVVVTGPRKGFKRALTKTKRGKLRYAKKGTSGEKYRNPVNYAHLVELGFDAVGRRPKPGARYRKAARLLRKTARFFGGGPRHVKGTHFLRHGFELGKYEAQAVIRQELAAGVEQEATAAP